jgi:hypothetical protein
MPFSVTPGVCARAEVIATIIVNSNDKAARGKKQAGTAPKRFIRKLPLAKYFPRTGLHFAEVPDNYVREISVAIVPRRARVTNTRDSRK